MYTFARVNGYFLVPLLPYTKNLYRTYLLKYLAFYGISGDGFKQNKMLTPFGLMEKKLIYLFSVVLSSF